MSNPTFPSPATTDAAGVTEALNSLLRGEISAVQTYEQALSKFEQTDHKTTLTQIRDEHTKAVSVLREHVRTHGGEPSTDSGPWGTFASLVTGAAKVVGPQSVLAALKQGEEHGISQYEKALEADALAGECKTLVRTDLLPRCRKHLTQLDSMIAALKS